MRFVFLVFSVLFCLTAFSQTDSSSIVAQSESNLNISILTCGAGSDLYSSFGHIGIRVQNKEFRTDEVYNYGTFDYSDPDFYVKFTRGKLLYYISKSSYSNFMYEYEQDKRSVVEQVLNLPDEKKVAALQYLENNLKPENKSYHYDFLYDNCATRIRDFFPQVLGDNFYWGDVLNNKNVSYRTAINQYLVTKNWERLGINLLLGSPVDSLMTDESSMFLPDFLHEGLKEALYNNQNIVASENKILESGPAPPRRLNGPLWMMIGILILTILSFHIPAFHYLKPILRFTLLFSSGLLGLFMLFMWFFTNHQACAENYNILWAFPPNLYVAFIAHKKRLPLKVYGLAAISFLMVALIIHVIGIQKMPLIETAPFLLSLMYVYIDLYKNNLSQAKLAPAEINQEEL